MIKIMYPPYSFKIKEEEGKEMIFDPARKTWVKLNPEEWVRQNFLQYLLQVAGYPVSLIAIEKELQLGELKKRFDILVYDRDHQPWMMIECKSMDVELKEDVLSQILRYHIAIPVPFLVVTNGSWCSAFEKVDGKLVEVTEFPSFSGRV